MNGRYIREHRFLLLLIALSFLLTSYPFEERSAGGRMVFQIIFDLVLLAGLFAMRNAGGWVLLGATLVVPAVALFWVSVIAPGSAVASSIACECYIHFAMGAYLALLVAFILRDLFAGSRVTVDRLYGAVSAYLLMGVMWGFFYTGLELLRPGSFAIGDGLITPSAPDAGLMTRSGVLFYFSFVTLTTLGFGDVSPVGRVAQMLTMWEAILGQVFLTILVARLVGMHLSAAQPARERDESGTPT